MARTKGTIPLSMAIEPNIGAPLDAREKVNLKSDLTNPSSFPYPWVGMEVYCAEDGKKYRLINENFTNMDSWKNIDVADEENVEYQFSEFNSRLDNLNAFMNNINDLQRRVSELENFSSDSKILRTVSCDFDNNVMKVDILPIHEVYQFCREFSFRYTSDFIGTERSEIIKINNKPLNFSKPIGEGSTSQDIRIIDIVGKINKNSKAIEISIFKDDVFVEKTEISDSFILTIEVESIGENPLCSSVDAILYKMKYIDIDLDYPYPVFECRDGTVLYLNSAPTKAMGATYDLLACYNLGNLTTNLYGGGNYCDSILNTSLDITTKNQYVPSGHKGCEYVYMANWLWMKNVVTNGLWYFHALQRDNEIFDEDKSIVKQLDFSKIHFDKINSYGFVNPFYGYQGDTIADDIITVINSNHTAGSNQLRLSCPNVKNYGSNLYKLDPKDWYMIQFKNSRSLETLGDLSDWDVTTLGSLEVLFSNCYMLKYVGDCGKWGEKGPFNASKVSNIFKACVNLSGISDKIRTWRFPNADTLAWTFENTHCIGDDTLHGLGEWEVGNIKNMRGVFSYYVETTVAEAIRRFFVIERHESLPPIKVPKTDLSFVENWDMHSVEKLQGFFANNPYLINVGDLRKWNLTSPTLTTRDKSNGFGLFGFLENCTALENLKMPSIPRGVDVDDFVKGCTSLTNIEVDELNVESISFADCPLTKQSILNLINAATDDVEIILKSDVYNSYASDQDVVSAINIKANSNITVQLISA